MNINGRNPFTLYSSRFLEAKLTVSVPTDDAIHQFTQVDRMIPYYQHEGMRLTPTRENSNPVPEIARHDRHSAKPFVEITEYTIISSDMPQ